jgi:hypothetical protein
MPIGAPTLLVAGSVTANHTVWDLSGVSVTPAANALVVVGETHGTLGANAAEAIAVTGWGITFTQAGPGQHFYLDGGVAPGRLSLWYGSSPSPTADTVNHIQITYQDVESYHSLIAWAFPGVNTTTPVVQVQQANGHPDQITTFALPLAPFAATGNAGVALFVLALVANAITPRAGWTELTNHTASSPARTLELQYHIGDDDASASWTDAAWVGCNALELAAVVAEGPLIEERGAGFINVYSPRGTTVPVARGWA